MSKILKELGKKYQIKSKNSQELEEYQNSKNYKAQKRILFWGNSAKFGELDQVKLNNSIKQV